VFTKSFVWMAIAALVLGLFWRTSLNYRLVVDIVVCLAAVLAFIVARRERRYFWAAGFVVVAILANPISARAMNDTALLMTEGFCLLAMMTWLFLGQRERLTVQSVTNVDPRRLSL